MSDSEHLPKVDKELKLWRGERRRVVWILAASPEEAIKVMSFYGHDMDQHEIPTIDIVSYSLTQNDIEIILDADDYLNSLPWALEGRNPNDESIAAFIEVARKLPQSESPEDSSKLEF